MAGIAATSQEQRIRARITLADISLSQLLNEPIIPYEADEVTRLICDSHNEKAFQPISSLCVGDFRDWLLTATEEELKSTAPGITTKPEASMTS